MCVELVRSTAFERCVLSRLEGDTCYPWMAHFAGDPDIERRIVERIRGKAVSTYYADGRLGHNVKIYLNGRLYTQEPLAVGSYTVQVLGQPLPG